MDENFNKFKKKIMIEHLIKSIIYSVSLGLGITSILFVIFKRIPLILNFFVYLIIGVIISLIAFYLLYNAYKLGKNASCLMTVVDSIFKDSHATTEERESNLNKMIELALDSI